MKFGENLDINIKNYLGRIGPGVTITLSIIYNDKLYEGMYWYTDEYNILQFPEEIEKELGHKIEDHDEYNNIMEYMNDNKGDYEKLSMEMDDIFNPPPSGTESSPDLDLKEI